FPWRKLSFFQDSPRSPGTRYSASCASRISRTESRAPAINTWAGQFFGAGRPSYRDGAQTRAFQHQQFLITQEKWGGRPLPSRPPLDRLEGEPISVNPITGWGGHRIQSLSISDRSPKRT